MQWCYINNGTLVTILLWNEEGSRRHDEPCAVELAVKIKKIILFSKYLGPLSDSWI